MAEIANGEKDESKCSPRENKCSNECDEGRFFAMLFRQKYIRRWSLMRNVTPETLSEHAAEVAVVAHALALIGNRSLGASHDEGRAVLLALYHDAAEVYTGDLPTPVKYFSPRSRESYRELERAADRALLEGLPPELRAAYEPLLSPPEGEGEGERRLVKAADKICAYLKCVEEEKSGNREFSSAKESSRAAITALHCPEADIFMERYAPAFSRNLDELG